MTQRRQLAQLAETANEAARALRDVTRDKPPTEKSVTDVSSLETLASLIEALSTEMHARGRAHVDAMRALERISGLKVRNASALIEDGNWKRLAEELQSIAESALRPGGTPAAAGVRSTNRA